MERRKEYTPKIVLQVTLLKYRKISVSYFHDRVIDTPDVYFVVSCPKLRPKVKFSTITKKNQPTGKINESFNFVLSEDKHQEEFPIKIKVYDEDPFRNNYIGKVKFDVSSVELGTSREAILIFPNDAGELDVKVSKICRTGTDFRLSTELNDDEKVFRQNRAEHVAEAIRRLTRSESPQSDVEAPEISVVGSGGGYRAVIGMSGGMKALKDHGLLDALMYVSGLSGSAWYITSALSHEGLLPKKQDTFHDQLKEGLSRNLYKRIFSIKLHDEYTHHYKSSKLAHQQPTSFVDFFGYALGSRLLREEHKNLGISSFQSQFKQGEMPYPLLTSIHAKPEVPTSEFHAYVESSPFEISLPIYGINIKPEIFGSHWNQGLVTRPCPELPLHFYLGSCGCAFSILLKSLVNNGGEESQNFVHYIEGLLHNANTSVAVATRQNSIEEESAGSSSSMVEKAQKLIPKRVLKDLKKSCFFRNRRYFIDRTAEVVNFAKEFSDIEVNVRPGTRTTTEDQLGDQIKTTGSKNTVIERMGFRDPTPMSTEADAISICDAGILKNVSLECVLRPERRSDLIIVFDMNSYQSDEVFDYMPILQSAEHAWRNGLKFPNIDFEELVKLPPQDFLLFESDDNDCPTIMWFTLCNKNFKNLKNYQQRSTSKPKHKRRKSFNDFPVFGPGSFCSTYNFKYSDYHFDQLHELMYYNVSSHVQEIKEQVAKALTRKLRRTHAVS